MFITYASDATNATEIFTGSLLSGSLRSYKIVSTTSKDIGFRTSGNNTTLCQNPVVAFEIDYKDNFQRGTQFPHWIGFSRHFEALNR